MDSMTYILFICIAVPIALMLLPIDKKSRNVVLAMLIGMFCCLFVSEVNGLLLKYMDTSTGYFTTNVTPITEELVKTLPIVFFAAIVSTDRKSIITFAFALGVGFAMLENTIILTQHIESVNLFFAVVRGFSSGLMHSICTLMISIFIPYIYSKKKYYICGTLCMFNLALVYHSVFNLLVEANSTAANHIGYFMPIVTYSILNAFFLRRIIERKKNNNT